MFQRILAAAVVWVLFAASDVSALQCRLGTEPTVCEDAVRNETVFFGRPVFSHEGPEGGFTDFVILRRLKGTAALGPDSVVQIPLYLKLPEPKKPDCMLLFGSMKDGQFIPSRGVWGTAALADYVAEHLAIPPKDTVKRLHFCFHYLDHTEEEIASDAYSQFRAAEDADARAAAKTLPAAKLRRWLQQEGITPDRLRLFAALLGHCGTRDDAVLLRRLIDRSEDQCDEMLTAYTLLDPQRGWPFVRKLADKHGASFVDRHAVLRTVRTLWSAQPDLVGEKEILAVLQSLMREGDFADLVVVELIDRRCWKLTSEVLAMDGKKGFEEGIVRRAIVRYVLECPDAASAKHLAELRARDPQRVERVVAVLLDQTRGRTRLSE